MARSRISTKFLLPTEDSGRIALFFGFFDPALRLIEHGKAGVGKDVDLIDFDEFLGRRYGLLNASAIEKSHAEPMKGILIVRIKVQGFLIGFNSLVQLLVAKRVYRLFEIIFLRHSL